MFLSPFSSNREILSSCLPGCWYSFIQHPGNGCVPVFYESFCSPAWQSRLYLNFSGFVLIVSLCWCAIVSFYFVEMLEFFIRFSVVFSGCNPCTGRTSPSVKNGVCCRKEAGQQEWVATESTGLRPVPETAPDAGNLPQLAVRKKRS